MIQFNNWVLYSDGEFLVRQYDNLTRRLQITGDIPNDWEFSLLVRVLKDFNIISLLRDENGLYVDLTSDMIPINGKYQIQLKGTSGGKVRHSNIIQIYVGESMSGDVEWPEIPSEFTQIENNIKEINNHPPIPGENGFWEIWDVETKKYVESKYPLPSGGETGKDGGYYIPEINQETDYTFDIMYSPSDIDMPKVEVYNVKLPKGEDGFSPTVETEKIIGGTKVTITDKNGDHEFEVKDGENGDSIVPIPTKGDEGKSIVVNSSGEGLEYNYILPPKDGIPEDYILSIGGWKNPIFAANKSYELINEINVSEADVMQIEQTFNGDYISILITNFDILSFSEIPARGTKIIEAGYINCISYFDGQMVSKTNLNIIPNTDKYYVSEIKITNGMIYAFSCIMSYASGNLLSTGSYYSSGVFNRVSDNNCINSLIINASQGFSQSAKVYIFGVRA